MLGSYINLSHVDDMSIDINNLESEDPEVSLWKHIIQALKAETAYVLVFGVSALFVLSGLTSTTYAVIEKDIQFGILGFASFAIALLAVVIVVRVVEQNSRSGEKVVTLTEPQAENSITGFDNYGQYVERIKELLKSPKDGQHNLKFLAVTGRSPLMNYLGELIKDFKGHLDIELQVIDPDGPYLNLMPNHWKSEVESTIQEITNIFNARPKDSGTLKVFKYKYLPCIIGHIFNEDHLILCLFGWDHQTKKLNDFKEHYFYYKRSSKTEKDFELFQSWFDHAPKLDWDES